MSKFRGKFSKNKDFEGERGAADKGRSEGRSKSPSKDRSVKYRKKNFRDFGSDKDEDGSKRSAQKDFNTSGQSGRQAERSENARPRSQNREHDARRQSADRERPFKREPNARDGGRSETGRRTDKRAEDARHEGTRRPDARRREGGRPDTRGVEGRRGDRSGDVPKQEPPTYDILPTSREQEGKVSADEKNIRLNKYIADAGVCSRREADKLIEAGEIKVNGNTVTELGYKVSRKDAVTYNGRRLSQEKLVYVLLNKPKDFITTVDDPEDRKTVMQLVQTACDERIYPVGRLDRNTTGLLLLTNDGELATRLTHPSHNVKKIYQVDLDKPLTEEDAEKIREGLMLEDGEAKVDELAILSEDQTILGVEIHIGRNRIVRRIFEHLGYEVIRLDRVMFAGLTKKDLPRGKWRYLSQKELIRLKHFK